MSSNSAESSSAPSQTFTSHLRDLLPIQKHAVFHIKLVIHQLQSVPLISGDFRIKWKFKHLQAVNSDGRPLGFGRALARRLDSHKKKTTTDASSSLKGKTKEIEMANAEDHHVIIDEADPVTSSPTTMLPVEFPSEDHGRPTLKHVNNSNSTESSASTKSHIGSSSDLLDVGSGVAYNLNARGYTPYHPLKDFKVNFETDIDAAVQMSIERDTRNLLPSELKLTIMQLATHGDPEAPQNPRLGHVEVNLAEYANVGPVTRNYLLRRSKVNALLRMTLTVSHMSGEESYNAPPLRKEEVKAGIASYLSTVNIPLPMFTEGVHTSDPWLASVLPQVTPPQPEPEPELNALELGGLQIPRPDSRNSSYSMQPPKKRWHVGGSRPSSRRTSDTSASNLTASNDPPTPPSHSHGRHSHGDNHGHHGHGHDYNQPSASSKFKFRDKTRHAPPMPPNPKPKKPPPQLHPTELLIEAIFNPYPSTSGSPSPFTYYVPHVEEHLGKDGAQKLAHNSSDTNSITNSNANSNSPRPNIVQNGSLSGAGTEGSRTSFESGSSFRVGGGVSEGGHSYNGAASVHGSAGHHSVDGSPGKPWWQRKKTASRPVTPAPIVRG